MRFSISNPEMMGCGGNVIGPPETRPLTADDLELGRAKADLAMAREVLGKLVIEKESLRKVLGIQKTSLSIDQALGSVAAAERRVQSLGGGVR